MTPVPPGPAEQLDLGGWPWDQLAEATLRADDARRRAWEAQVIGDRHAQQQAEWERTEALADHHKIRQQLADQWLAGLRAAIALDPAAVAALLDQLPTLELIRTAIEELEDVAVDTDERVERLEAVALDLIAETSEVPG